MIPPGGRLHKRYTKTVMDLQNWGHRTGTARMTVVAIALDTVVAPSEDAVFRELDGQSVLLNLATGMYFGLDAVGTHVWQLAAANGSLRGVLQSLVDEYDADPSTIERDLLALAEALVAKGLWSIV